MVCTKKSKIGQCKSLTWIFNVGNLLCGLTFLATNLMIRHYFMINFTSKMEKLIHFGRQVAKELRFSRGFFGFGKDGRAYTKNKAQLIN